MDRCDVIAGSATGVTGQLKERRVKTGFSGGFSHSALLYRNYDEYLSGLARFAESAAEIGAPLQAVLPGGQLASLAELPLCVTLADMTDLGRNPARLIASGQAFAEDHLGKHVCCVWEPVWPGRSSAELCEVTRHEALSNLAFTGQQLTLLCLYDASTLSAESLRDIELTHPTVILGRQRLNSAGYLGPGRMPARCDAPLPPPPADAESLAFTENLGEVREIAARHAEAAGLSRARVHDLRLAVSEVAANALGYAKGGVLKVWHRVGEVICQIEDDGYISDLLAGRRRQPADQAGGHGLWLVNLVCDLVERRTGPTGTMTRLHMRAAV
jgi:anti-sigma regulatory factor (Ser/Thr protein kinase)